MKKMVIMALCVLSSLALKSQISILKPISCNGENNGALQVIAPLGAKVLWSTGDTTRIVFELGTGLYTCTVTDTSTKTFRYFLPEPAKIMATYTTTPNSYWPSPNGNILVNASGGTGSLKIKGFDSTNFNHEVIYNQFDSLFSGVYYIQIQDILGCQRLDTVYVPENAGISANFNIDYTACYHSTADMSIVPGNIQLPTTFVFPRDTVVIVKIIGGNRPYITSRNDTLDAVHYSAYPGENFVKVYTPDKKGIRNYWFVKEPQTQLSLSWEQTNILCHGSRTGRVEARSQGSYDDFSYQIRGEDYLGNNFSSDDNYNDHLYAGSYIIRAEDSTGCSIEQTVIITQPEEPIRIHFQVTQPSFEGASDGEISIDLENVTKFPVSLLWNTGETTENINGASGLYKITVKDGNNCTSSDSIMINESKESFEIPNLITPNGDGENDVFDLRAICGSIENIKITTAGGEVLFEAQDCSTFWDGKDKNGKAIESGKLVFAYIKTKNKEYWKTITILY